MMSSSWFPHLPYFPPLGCWQDLQTFFWQIKCGRSDEMSLLRLGYKKKSWLLSWAPSFIPLLQEKAAAMLWVALWRGPHGKEKMFLGKKQERTWDLSTVMWVSLEIGPFPIEPWGGSLSRHWWEFYEKLWAIDMQVSCIPIPDLQKLRLYWGLG